MLQPKRTKFRKAHKGRIHGKAKGGMNLDFGAFGLKAQEPARITARQIEAARRAITRHMKRAGRFPRSRPKFEWARARARRNTGRRA
jgi:large subunit ribosomal protein L16